MADSYDAFERWIKGMDEQMYEDWLEDTATEAQEEKALNIRQPLDEEELQEMEREQTYIPESRQKEVEVYDNRDLPPKRIYAEVILPPTGKAPIIKPIDLNPTKGVVDFDGGLRSQTTPTGLPAKPASSLGLGKQPSFFSRIRTAFSRINIFRRKR